MGAWWGSGAGYQGRSSYWNWSRGKGGYSRSARRYPPPMTRRSFIGGGCAAVGFPFLRRFLSPDVLEAVLAKAKAGHWRDLPMGALVGEVGKCFLGTPYVGQTLEVSDSVESCVINLKGLDCVTFFETSL